MIELKLCGDCNRWMFRSELIYSQDITCCNQLFRLNAFRNLIKFLLGVDPEQVEEVDENDLYSRSRRWSTLQGREFGGLHAAISYLVLSCDTEPKRSHSK